MLLSIKKQRSWSALRLPAEAIKDANTSRSKLRAALFALQRGCSGLFNVAYSARCKNNERFQELASDYIRKDKLGR